MEKVLQKKMDSPETGLLNPQKIRSDFPILHRVFPNGKKLAYLDNAATTQKPTQVIQAIHHYYCHSNSNVHRALHQLASEATAQYEAARESVGKFIHAPKASSVIFTHGATESINLVAHAWGRSHIHKNDVILLTEMEHHSNLIPWQMLAKEKEAQLRFIPVLEDGTLDLDAYTAFLAEGVRLVAITQMSNVLGTINPIEKMVKQAHDTGALVLVDAAQSVPHSPVDVQLLDCDFLVFSGHKMCGPMGIGVLYGREEILAQMNPFMGGGEMILKVNHESSTWNEIPYKFEAGTPPVAGAVGLAAAIDYLAAIGMDVIQKYEQELTQYAIKQLQQIPGIRIFGHAAERGGALSFELPGLHPHDVAQFVDRDGIAIRAGHHCAQLLMRKLGVMATSRASFYFYNLHEEIDRLVESLSNTKAFFKHEH